MIHYTVSAQKLIGTIELPPFKSEVIRMLLLYALSEVRPSSVVKSSDSYGDDIKYAISAADSLYDAIINGTEPKFEVGESATLFRLLIPMVLALFGEGKFILGKSIIKRCEDEYIKSLNCKIHISDNCMTVKGDLHSQYPCCFSVSTQRSSQFASGILMTLPLLDESSLRIVLSDKEQNYMVSMPYFNLTKQIMQLFGVRISEYRASTFIQLSAGGAYTAPSSYAVSGDGSYAANFIAANHFGSDVNFTNAPEYLQADAEISKMLELNEIDITDCPDIFPILAIAACAKCERTVIYGTNRLRTKECDRVHAMYSGITALGGCVRLHRDCVEIFGSGQLHGGIIDSYFDHRIAMAFAIASLLSDTPITIMNASAVNKSAPQFFNDFKKLGGAVHEYLL